jgi:AraC-like DNA-binding protein
MPDGYAELVFVFGPGYERADLDTSATVATMRHSYVIGGRSRSIVTRDQGRIRVIGVKLEPRSLRGLIRSPLTDFRDRTVRLCDLNDRGLLDLEDQLANCRHAHDIADLLNRFLLARQAAMSERDPIVEHLMRRTRAERGATPLTRAASDYGIDPRTLERRFIAWSGMSAKSYCRIVRFKLAYHAFLQRRLATLALDGDSDPLHGYYDQSHFIREFRFFTGTSPRQLAAQRTPASTDVTNLLLVRDVSAG